MKTTLRHSATAILVSLGIALPAAATTFGIDYTDLWYNAPAESESGWGVNLIQQNEILFVTLFVYGTDGTPRWFVGPATAPAGANAFAGPLYTVTGSYYGAAWTGAVGTQVGQIGFTFQSDSTGTLTYNVGAVTVTKNIVRQFFRYDVLTGNYIGGTVAAGPGCTDGILIHGELTVTQSVPSITMVVDFVNNQQQTGRCTYTGSFSQVGSLAAINGGTYNCTIGGTTNALFGNFSIAEIKAGRNGFSGRITGTSQFCNYTGYFGGIKDVF